MNPRTPPPRSPNWYWTTPPSRTSSSSSSGKALVAAGRTIDRRVTTIFRALPAAATDRGRRYDHGPCGILLTLLPTRRRRPPSLPSRPAGPGPASGCGPDCSARPHGWNTWSTGCAASVRRRFGRAGPLSILCYRGFGNRQQITVLGRVVESRTISLPSPGDSRWRNVMRVVRHFNTREVAEATLQIRLGESSIEVHTDEEGYFRAQLPRPVLPAHEAARTGTPSTWSCAIARCPAGRRCPAGPRC